MACVFTEKCGGCRFIDFTCCSRYQEYLQGADVFPATLEKIKEDNSGDCVIAVFHCPETFQFFLRLELKGLTTWTELVNRATTAEESNRFERTVVLRGLFGKDEERVK